MVAYAGSTVIKLTQAEYVQADAVSGTRATACKTQCDDSNNVLAVSSVALACMCVINALEPTSFSTENACYPSG